MSRIFPAPIIGQSAASGAQVIDGSLNFNGSKSQSLTRTVGSGNQTTWTWSAWVKTDPNQVNGSGGFAPMFFGGLYNTSGYQTHIAFGGSGGTSGQLMFTHYSGSSYTTNLRSSSRFRDIGWYHIVVVFDSNNSTSGDRARVYVNGERVTAWSSETYPSSGGTTWINDSSKFHGIGKDDKSATENCFDGLMSQTYFIDGQALDASYFGFTDPLTNTWKPKKLSKLSGPNDGRIWTNTATISSGSNAANKPLSNGFDGTTATAFEGDTTGATVTVPVSATISAGGVRVFAAVTSGNPLVVAIKNGASTVETINTGSSGGKYYASSSYSGAITSLVISRTGRAPEFNAIEINGTMLIDGDRTNFGSNGFYLPFDGNSLIGQDKSGRGNDWTPVNFGGSVELDSPAVSGGRPFLNVTQGGTQAGVGVFGSKENQVYTVTYADDGGGNKYYIDGVKQPTLNGLIRGSTYTFDTVALGSTHPFRLSATSAHGTEYTDGVVAITGTATTITMPHDAPDSLYYYCTAHSGMGSSITGITTNEKLADPYASNCVLAVSFSGGRYQDDSSLLNCTTSYYSVSSEGNINSGISTISNFYATSLYFDGSGDYYTTPSSNTSELGMGTGDFTIETWIYPTALASSDFIVNLTAADSVFGYDSDGTLNIQLPSSGAPALTQKGPKIVANKWNHFAVVRESGAVRGYVDGVLAATVTDTTDMGSTGKAVIGSHASLSREITGYLQDLRIYKGIAKYTSDFVVPATSPDVLPDSPSGVSGSSKLAKIIDGAVSFDGTGDLLSVPDSDDFHLGTNDFTIEYFVYKNSTQGTSSHHVSQYGTSNANRSFAFRSVALPFTDLQFRWYNGSNEYTMNWSEGWMRAKEGWKHVCVQRKSGVMYLYIDGKLWKTEAGASAALSINNSTAPLTIGGDSNTGSEFYLNGSISNFRFINGTAIYRTGGFVSPIAPLTTTSQGATESEVKLLCCQSPTNVRLSPVAPNVGITTTTRFNSNFESIPTTVNGLTVTNNGSVTTTSAGTNSYGFTNCADLDGSNSLSVDLGTIPALTTIDLVFKVTGTSDNKYVFGIGGNGLVRRSSSSFDWYNGSDTDITTSEIADGNWHHLRVTPTRLYFDNTLIENNTSLQFINNNTTADGDNSGHMALGAFRNGSGTIQYNGAIDFGLVRVMPGVDLGAPSSYPITTNGTLSDTETIPSDGIIVARRDATATTFNPFNTDINTVRGQETGYCTFNPLQKSSEITLSNGNLDLSSSNTSNKCKVFGTFSVSTGKYYYEVTIGTNRRGSFGWATTQDSNLAQQPGDSTGDYALTFDGNKISSGSYTASYGTAFATGTVIGVRLDADAGDIAFSIDGKDLGNAFTGQTGKTFWPIAGDASSGGTIDASVNFGQKPFKFPPPDGFQPLNNANTRPVKVISRPDQYVKVTTYTGTGNGTNYTDNSLNFKPDMTWFKRRDGAVNHVLYDSVRGYGDASKAIRPNTDGGESAFGDAVVTANSNGFSVTGSNTGGINGSSEEIVCWAWKAGGSKGTFNKDDVGYDTAAAAGLSGQSSNITINGCSIGTKQGFSIVKVTPSDNSAFIVPHGLSQTPDFLIIKNLGASQNWDMYFSGVTGSTQVFELNTDLALTTTGVTVWNTVDSTKVSARGASFATSSNSRVVYFWHSVPGLQKFGTYTGNATRNPFIELGFRPALLWIKNISTGSTDWVVIDSQRQPVNQSNMTKLYISSTSSESTIGVNNQMNLDFLSNGFKLRDSNNKVNASGDTYVYCAWAEAPSIDLYGGGANAR